MSFPVFTTNEDAAEFAIDVDLKKMTKRQIKRMFDGTRLNATIKSGHNETDVVDAYTATSTTPKDVLKANGWNVP